MIRTLSDLELNIFEEQSLYRPALNVTLVIDSIEDVQALHHFILMIIGAFRLFVGLFLGSDSFGSLLLVIHRLME